MTVVCPVGDWMTGVDLAEPGPAAWLAAGVDGKGAAVVTPEVPALQQTHNM